MINQNELKALQELDTTKVEKYFWSELRNAGARDFNPAYSAAYVLVKAAETENADLSSLDAFLASCEVGEDIARYLTETLEGIWGVVTKVRGIFSVEMFKAFLLFSDRNDARSGWFEIPVSIARLSAKLLDVKGNHSVADHFTGTGTFIRECYSAEPCAFYHGSEVEWHRAVIAGMRAEILGDTVTIENRDSVSDPGDQKYDRIFANCPLGGRPTRVDNSPAIQFANNILSETRTTLPVEWAVSITILNTLNTDGKAVLVTSAGMLFRGGVERDLRKYFVDNGCVEAVIALPSEMTDYTRIPLLLFVISSGNTGVRFIDASGICVRGRRYNTFSDENIAEIIRLRSEDSEISRFVSKEKIAERDYLLEPRSYFERKKEIRNGVPFGDIIKNVTRGSQMKAAQLDQIASVEPTNCCYLRLADIQNGQIEDELPYLISIEKSLKKYCVKNRSLIISKIGNPTKTAVVNAPEGMTILATGNMYAVELDESRADPYYVQAFLESCIGAEYLSSMCVGAAIPNLPIESLKSIMIPLPDMEIQRKYAEEFIASLEEIKELKTKIAEAEQKIKHRFDELADEV